MRRRIALVIGPYGRAVFRGITRYVQTTRAWSLWHVGIWQTRPSRMARRSVDGVIVQLTSERFAAALRASGLPAVNVSSHERRWDLPTVDHDDEQIGRMAAGHFLERGFGSFAYYGPPHEAYSRRRGDGFRDAVAAAGRPAPVWLESRRDWTPGGLSRLACRIRRLPRPLAILTCDDVHAHQVAKLCFDHGLRIPDEVAVLGVDNDEVFCELSDVPLSSVQPDFDRVGFLAAQTLDRILDGQPPPPAPMLLPPLEVVTRPSTDVLMVADAAVAEALRLMRDRAGEPITVDDVADSVGIGRRSMERRFRTALGCSPLKELVRLRLDAACRLLRETDMPMPRVAQNAGFSDPTYMARVFRRTLGIGPARYRRQFRVT